MERLLNDTVKATIKDAAEKLTGHRKRAFMAKVAQDYFEGSARKAETVLGWNRHSVQLGLHEKRSGMVCVDNYRGRGRHKTEAILQTLEADIRTLVDAQAQADPKFQVKPLKKIAQTDAIFANVAQANQSANTHPKTLRLSIDTKAKVKIGNLSRNGKARTLEANKADDHDSEWESVLVPFGILNLDNDELSIYFGQSAETSDFIVDCLEWWWQDNQALYPEVEQWVLNLDGGPATRSDRTQFIKRMVELSQSIDMPIRLIYYPPYHSKYNPIERCWAALENYWNGAILDSVEAVVQWASHRTWKAMNPIIYLVEGIYEKGIKVSAEDLESYLPF